MKRLLWNSSIKELAKVAGASSKPCIKEEPEKLVEGMIVKALLIQEAKKQGISPPVKTYKDGSKGFPVA